MTAGARDQKRKKKEREKIRGGAARASWAARRLAGPRGGRTRACCCRSLAGPARPVGPAQISLFFLFFFSYLTVLRTVLVLGL
jgi:hypothetical protein